jgi:hypothetical protein
MSANLVNGTSAHPCGLAMKTNTTPNTPNQTGPEPYSIRMDEPTEAERQEAIAGFFGKIKANNEERRAAVEVARPALDRLCRVMIERTGQSYKIRDLLYSLYNGQEASLLEIVALDWAIRKDLCAVLLAFGYEKPRVDGVDLKDESKDFIYAAMKAAIAAAGLLDWFLEAHKESEVAE